MDLWTLENLRQEVHYFSMGVILADPHSAAVIRVRGAFSPDAGHTFAVHASARRISLGPPLVCSVHVMDDPAALQSLTQYLQNASNLSKLI
jgi:hypothetical protein